jgi:hypothetical protein
MRKTLVAGLVAAAFSLPAAAQTVWVDWTAATDPASGTVVGSASGNMAWIGVQYTGEVADPTQVSGGTNYWVGGQTPVGTTPYTPGPPPSSDIIALTGGSSVINTITFSQPVTNPLLYILSLGQQLAPAQYSFAFDQPFDVVSSGRGYWGGDPAGSLAELGGNVLVGSEGHGTIQFQGTFSQLSWRADPYEYWHGFTVAFAVPEPETYAMMLAGLGLLGFMVRRRTKGLQPAFA